MSLILFERQIKQLLSTHSRNNDQSTRFELQKSFRIKISIIPSLFGGRRTTIFNPFSLDKWYPFRDFHFQLVSLHFLENIFGIRERRDRLERNTKSSR